MPPLLVREKAVRTWGQTTQYANALEEIIQLINRYLPPDSGVGQEDVVSEVIGIIETKTDHRFLKSVIKFPAAE